MPSSGEQLHHFLIGDGWRWLEEEDCWEKKIANVRLTVSAQATCEALNSMSFDRCVSWFRSHELTARGKALQMN